MFEDDFAPPLPPRPIATPAPPVFLPPADPSLLAALPPPQPSLNPSTSSSNLKHSRPRPRYSTNPSASGVAASIAKYNGPGPGEWMRSRSRSVSVEPVGAAPPIPQRPPMNGNVKDNLAQAIIPDKPEVAITREEIAEAVPPSAIQNAIDGDGDIAMASPSLDGSSTHMTASIGRPTSSHFSNNVDIVEEGGSSGSASNSGYGSVLHQSGTIVVPPTTGGTSFFSPASPSLSATSFPLPPMPPPNSTPTQTTSKPRRPLPPRPHAPSPTLVPSWEPDIKSHIPPSLTLDSRLAAYSTQAAPPPRLRTAVREKEDRKKGGREGYGRLRGRAEKEELILDRRSSSGNAMAAGSSSAHAQSAREDSVRGIAGEWWLDPVLITRELMAQGKDAWGGRATFSRGMSSRGGMSTKNGNGRMNGGLDEIGPNPAVKCAKLAVLDGKINVRLCIVDEVSHVPTFAAESASAYPTPSSGATDPTSPTSPSQCGRPDFVDGFEQTRTKARVEVESRRGDVRIEVAQMDGGRQVSLSVRSKSGNILVLLPDTYRGTIHCSTASNRTTTLLPALRKSFRVVKDWRGETVGYLGRPSTVSSISSRPAIAPDLPARRSSARLRGVAAESSIAERPSMSTHGAGPYPRDGSWRTAKARDKQRAEITGGSSAPGLVFGAGQTVSSSPPPMNADIDMEDDKTGQATVADDETIKQVDEDEDGPESLVSLSSYTGEVAIGLYGHEGEEEFLTYVPGFGNGKGIAGTSTSGPPGMSRARSASVGLALDSKGKGKASVGVADAVAKGKGKGREVMKKGMRFLGV